MLGIGKTVWQREEYTEKHPKQQTHAHNHTQQQADTQAGINMRMLSRRDHKTSHGVLERLDANSHTHACALLVTVIEGYKQITFTWLYSTYPDSLAKPPGLNCLDPPPPQCTRRNVRENRLTPFVYNASSDAYDTKNQTHRSPVDET